jgi:hypothetical protein
MTARKLILDVGTIAITALAFFAFKPVKFAPGTLWTDSTGTCRQTFCQQMNPRTTGLCPRVTYYTQNCTSLGQIIAFYTPE